MSSRNELNIRVSRSKNAVFVGVDRHSRPVGTAPANSEKRELAKKRSTWRDNTDETPTKS
jgi:hypothetical protein